MTTKDRFDQIFQAHIGDGSDEFYLHLIGNEDKMQAMIGEAGSPPTDRSTRNTWNSEKGHYDAEKKDQAADGSGLPNGGEDQEFEGSDGEPDERGPPSAAGEQCPPVKNDPEDVPIKNRVNQLNTGLPAARYARCEATTSIYAKGKPCYIRQCRSIVKSNEETNSKRYGEAEWGYWMNNEDVKVNAIRNYVAEQKLPDKYQCCHRHKHPAPFAILKSWYEEKRANDESSFKELIDRALTTIEERSSKMPDVGIREKVLALIQQLKNHRNEDGMVSRAGAMDLIKQFSADAASDMAAVRADEVDQSNKSIREIYDRLTDELMDEYPLV